VSTVVRPSALTPGTVEWREFSAYYVAEALKVIVRELAPLPQMLAEMDEHGVDPDLELADVLLLWRLVNEYVKHQEDGQQP
jgi:hypothetical protein